MIYHKDLEDVTLKELIHSKSIQFAGHMKLSIYGMLRCASGKRMKKQNRVFFSTEKEAISAGFRPCGHCLRKKYLLWKSE